MQLLPDSDLRMIDLASKELARCAGLEGKVEDTVLQPQHLGVYRQVVTELEVQLRNCDIVSINQSYRPPPLDQLQSHADGGLSVPHIPFPLFDCLPRKDVSELAGEGTVPPYFRPIEMTLLPRVATDIHEVVQAMKHCDHLCILLENQRATVKNTYLHRCSLISHLFTSVSKCACSVLS